MSKKILIEKNLWLENFLGKQYFWLKKKIKKKVWVQRKCWLKNIFG